MTPEEYALELVQGLGSRNDVPQIVDCIRAALRERDAAHEIALRRARKDALREAVRAGELAWDAEIDRNSGNLPASAIMAALRALLEEAGK